MAVSTRCYQLAGCFDPGQLQLLDRAFDETMREVLASPSPDATGRDSSEIAAAVASLIVCHAKAGDLDPTVLKTRVIAALQSGQHAVDRAL